MAEDGGLEIQLHPLVVMSVADHYTREKLQYKRDRAYGLLFGQQAGRVVSVYEVLEMTVEIDSKAGVAKENPKLETDLKLFKESYPTYECLGWYSTAARIDASDAWIHTMMTQKNERPLFLLLDPSVTEDARELPITLYTEEVHVVGDKTTKDFQKCPFKIVADEAERVTVVHCAKGVGQEEDKSVSLVASHYATLSKAIGMLNARVRVLLQFLKDHQAGKVKAEQRVLRDIKALINRLPSMDSDKFRTDFLYELNDALLITYLTTITKGSSLINEVMDKFNITHASSRRMGGMGMGGMMGPMMGMGPMGMGMGMPMFGAF